MTEQEMQNRISELEKAVTDLCDKVDDMGHMITALLLKHHDGHVTLQERDFLASQGFSILSDATESKVCFWLEKSEGEDDCPANQRS